MNNKDVKLNCDIISESFYETIFKRHDIYFKIDNIIYKATFTKNPDIYLDCNIRIEVRDFINYSFLFDENYNDFYNDKFNELNDSAIKNYNYELLNSIIERLSFQKLRNVIDFSELKAHGVFVGESD
jgi:hypothetical protein